MSNNQRSSYRGPTRNEEENLHQSGRLSFESHSADDTTASGEVGMIPEHHSSDTLDTLANPNGRSVPIASNYEWAHYDPVVLRAAPPSNSGERESNRMDVLSSQIIVPLAGDRGSSRMDVLSPQLGRSRSLSRPERRTPTSAVPRHRSNILAASPENPYSSWSLFVHAVTCCVPSIFLSKILKMPELEMQRAWREKVALCVIIVFMCLVLGFITFGLQATICTIDSKTYPYSQLSSFGPPTNLQNNAVVIFGVVYDISSIIQSHSTSGISYFRNRPVESALISNATGLDVTPFFRHALSPTCQQHLQSSLSLQCTRPGFNGMLYCHNWDSLSGQLSNMVLGPVIYDWNEVSTLVNYTVFDGKILDMTAYFQSLNPMFGSEVDQVVRNYLNNDMTRALSEVPNGIDIGHCFVDLFSVGRLQYRSIGCWTADLILYISFAIVMGLVLVRFLFAIYFRWFISNKLGKLLKNQKRQDPLRKTELIEGRFPITMTDIEGNLILKHEGLTGPTSHSPASLNRPSLKSHSSYGQERHTIMLVTCYSEDHAALKLTFDALAETDYNEDFKLLLIIADGIIKGHGNDKSTPDLILDLLEIDTNWLEPEALSYLAVADGAKQHNKAKVYAAWYNHQGRSVPTILIVKTGLASETQKPGNRGKRDSQMILMRFLERITFNQRLCPLEYDLFLKMNYLMGTPPDFFEIVLMVDADTKVAADSLARMVACMVSDPTIMGMCGETRIGNKYDSWVTRIQVFEYYISHHLTKAFESMFGGVTCLPGCFCMYRIKARKGDSWIPILCAPEIIATYSQSVVDTLHKKNLLLLGEDRFLTTLMLRAFPRRKLIFVPRAFCKTTVPNTFYVLLSQRRRWINSTIHNLMELVLVNELCGIFCFSMQFVIFMELLGTVTLPAAICFTLLLIIVSIVGTPQVIPLILLGAILGLPAILILLTTRRWIYVYWMFVYLLALPIWNFILPVYAFWHFDDFSWGQTRKLEGGDTGHGYSDKSEIGPDAIPLRKWDEWERDRRANIVITYRRRNRMMEGQNL